MRTIKWLKTSIALQSVFAFFCIASALCFALNRYFDLSIFFTLGNILICGWIINPTGILTFVLGMSFYSSEKGNEDLKKIIGRKWIWFIAFLVIDTLLYLTAAALTVAFTGGV